jgi:hypothetical protein
MNSIFRRVLDQLLLELGLSAPSPAPAGAASQVRAIKELGAWLKQSFARVRDLFARIKVSAGSATSAAPNPPAAPAAAPASTPAPAAETAPTREPRPATPIATSDDGEASVEGHEPDALEPDDRRAVQGPGSTSQPTHGERTREPASRNAARGRRPTIVNRAA